MFGLCGPHRTGKTTLAERVAEQCGLVFLKTDVSGVFEAVGIDPKEELPFYKRLAMQNLILKKLREQYLAAGDPGKPWIADRTPLDVLMYTMAEVGRTNVPAALQPSLDKHIVRCYETMNLFFNAAFHLQPGIPLIDAPGKAPASKAYIEHCNMLIAPLAGNPLSTVPVYILPRDEIALHLRVRRVSKSVKDILNNAEHLQHAA